MITCPQCGAQNLPGLAYCETCGTPLPQQPASSGAASWLKILRTASHIASSVQ